MIKKLHTLVIVSLFAAIPAVAQQEGASQNSQSDSQSAPLPAYNNAARGATSDPNYVIGPQDVIDVNVWKEPDISRTVPVRPDGKISLPLLNDVQAAGMTPAQLGNQITASLKKFVTNPQVTVIV